MGQSPVKMVPHENGGEENQGINPCQRLPTDLGPSSNLVLRPPTIFGVSNGGVGSSIESRSQEPLGYPTFGVASWANGTEKQLPGLQEARGLLRADRGREMDASRTARKKSGTSERCVFLFGGCRKLFVFPFGFHQHEAKPGYQRRIDPKPKQPYSIFPLFTGGLEECCPI